MNTRDFFYWYTHLHILTCTDILFYILTVHSDGRTMKLKLVFGWNLFINYFRKFKTNDKIVSPHVTICNICDILWFWFSPLKYQQKFGRKKDNNHNIYQQFVCVCVCVFLYFFFSFFVDTVTFDIVFLKVLFGHMCDGTMLS